MNRCVTSVSLLALGLSACSGGDSTTEIPIVPDADGTPVAMNPDGTPAATPGEDPAATPPGTTPPGAAPPAGPGATPPGTTPLVPGEPVSGTQTKLRLLNASEYGKSLQVLFGGNVDVPELPTDTTVAGFLSVGSALASVNSGSVETYEAAAQAVAEQVFADEARWQAHVGCEPSAGLTGACIGEYIARFGRLAFRRALTPEEVAQWTGLASQMATTSGNDLEALTRVTASILQSPSYIYRVEQAVGDGVATRFLYEPYSVATRLAFLLTGATPTDALLSAAEQGQLGTPEGVRAIATELAADPANEDHLVAYFIEYAGLQRIDVIEKSANFEFPSSLRADMTTETTLWLKDLLAPGADIMGVFDSPDTYLNSALAEHYGVSIDGDGFVPYQFGPESGRAGLFGKGSFLATHSGANSSTPTRRGVFVLDGLLCIPAPEVPAGLDTNLEEEEGDGAPQTTRQRFEAHQANPQCAGCHSLMDNYGFALEHFDPVGRYRETENDLPIDAATEIHGQAVDGGADMAAVLRALPAARQCLVQKFYRYANAEAQHATDRDLVVALADAYGNSLFNWKQFIGDFVASDAFLSAPVDTRSALDEIGDEH